MNLWVSDTADDLTYQVVMNHEEQYSIWPVHAEIPAGWKAVELEGSKDECLAHIEKLWTDIRPLSLRACITELASAEPPELADELAGIAFDEPTPNTVDQLCTVAHQPVTISCRPATREAFRDAVSRGFVHVRFLTTGTELGIRLLPDSRLEDSADFTPTEGKIVLRGQLTLDFVPLRFSGSIQLTTLEGTGRLERADYVSLT